jgi:hypothetical protein
VHATIHQFRRSVATESAGWGAALMRDLHGSAPLGSCTLAQPAGAEGCVIAWWPTAAAAADAAARRTSAGPVWLDTSAYAVIESHVGAAADQQPQFVQLLCFDGPRSQAECDAAERAGRDRIWPAVRDVPGLVTVHVLRDVDNGEVVLGFGTSLETLEAVQRAVFATELLPDEDPALLRDPDRVQIARVVAAQLPTMTAMTAGASS